MAHQSSFKMVLRCWKEHICAGCGRSYSYRLVRHVSVQNVTAAAATAAAEHATAPKLKNYVEQSPCPTCGLYQPDMVGAWRAQSHTGFFIGLAFSLGALA